MLLMPTASCFTGTQHGTTFLSAAGRHFFARKHGQGNKVSPRARLAWRLQVWWWLWGKLLTATLVLTPGLAGGCSFGTLCFQGRSLSLVVCLLADTVEPINRPASLDFKHPVLRLRYSLVGQGQLVKGISARRWREQKCWVQDAFLGLHQRPSNHWGTWLPLPLKWQQYHQTVLHLFCQQPEESVWLWEKLLSVKEADLNWDAYHTDLDCSCLPGIHLMKDIRDFWHWGNTLFKATSAVW